MLLRALKWVYNKIGEGILWIIGGGKIKYKVIHNFLGTGDYIVVVKGGGTGWFWGWADFSGYEDFKSAEYWAKKWAEDEGGVYVKP